ncbi:hypothetical protein BIWAKO_00203 [Bosea sp. BIWAKO-01]|nr:hypothetical protein BIWAKO_00203 [Bosea sp. BIWAKO-01]
MSISFWLAEWWSSQRRKGDDASLCVLIYLFAYYLSTRIRQAS